MASCILVSVISDIVCDASSSDNEGRCRLERKALGLPFLVFDLVFSYSFFIECCSLLFLLGARLLGVQP